VYENSSFVGQGTPPLSYLNIVKQSVWIGLHGFDMLLSQHLFYIFKELSCMVVKGTIF
jgi:hypothetical protein